MNCKGAPYTSLENVSWDRVGVCHVERYGGSLRCAHRYPWQRRHVRWRCERRSQFGVECVALVPPVSTVDEARFLQSDNTEPAKGKI